MFDKIGQFSSKYRHPIIAIWIVLLVAISALAPNLADVSTSEQSDFLPEGELSAIAADVAAEYFPDKASPTQAVLVVKSETGSLRDETAHAYLADLTDWLENDLSPAVIGQVLSPADPNLADQLIGENGQVGMIFISLRGAAQDPAVVEALAAMQARLDKAPAGMVGYVTGGAAITNDYRTGARESAERTTLITIILVIVVLLIIYRSPVSPIVPLTTIAVAYGISRGLLAWLTNFGWTVSSMTDTFLVVVLFGAGTDYCLFLVSRFREFMADDLPGPEGARRTVTRVGETITSSAGTVIVGMVAMSFAEMKLFASFGPSLALGVFVALLAGLTLTPALLAVLGRWAFWPGRPRHAGEGGFWGRLASWVTARPWLPLTLAVLVLLPLAVYGQGQRRTFDLLADLPEEVSSKAGFLLLSENFGAGEVQPLDVIVTDIPDARSPEGMAHIHALTRDLLAVEGVADVRSLTLPAGQAQSDLGDALRVDSQLTLMADAIDDLRAQASNPSRMAEMDVSEATAGFDTLRAYLNELAAAFPDLSSNADYQTARDALDRLAEAIEAGRQRLLVSHQLAETAAGITEARAQLGQADTAAVEKLDETTAQFTALRTYLIGLADAYPAVASMKGYDDALAGLDSLEASVTKLGRGRLVSIQLDTIARQIDAMTRALETDSRALMPQPGQPSAAEQMTALKSYLKELGAAYPTLTATKDYQTAMAMLEGMGSALATTDPTRAAAVIGQAKQALPVLRDAFAGLSATAAMTLPQATFVPQTSLPGASATDSMRTLDADLADLATALERLSSATVTTLPGATYVPASGLEDPEAEAAAQAILSDVNALQAALRSLANDLAARDDAFFVPAVLAEDENGEGLTRLLDTYTSPAGDATRLQVILDDDPFSPAAMETVTRLREEVHHASQGYVSGTSAVLLDLRDVMDRDLVRVMALVLVGITIVLVLLLRSLVAPVYLMATILLSYGATLGLTRLVFDAIFHEGLTWWVPFFMFVLLVALGMDYNIFLMGRVKEEVVGHGTRAGVERAVQRTGGIITSAGIIMAGTFAAMMSSSLLGLVQIAFAVTVGVLLDTFVIRTTLVPAIAVLLGKLNWWPGRGPGQ